MSHSIATRVGAVEHVGDAAVVQIAAVFGAGSDDSVVEAVWPFTLKTTYIDEASEPGARNETLWSGVSIL